MDPEHYEPTRDQLAQALEAAANDLRSRDRDLIDTTERVVVARFLIYLEYYFNCLDNPVGFRLDMEYERARTDPKKFNGLGPLGPFKRKIVPDLIYHRRGDSGPGSNHLAIEIKTRRTSMEGHDLAKLSVLTGREPYAFVSLSPRILIRRAPTDPIHAPSDRYTVHLPSDFAPYRYGALLRLYKSYDFIQWI